MYIQTLLKILLQFWLQKQLKWNVLYLTLLVDWIKQANPNTSWRANLDVADFSKGAYLVKLNAGNKEATYKVYQVNYILQTNLKTHQLVGFFTDIY